MILKERTEKDAALLHQQGEYDEFLTLKFLSIELNKLCKKIGCDLRNRTVFAVFLIAAIIVILYWFI